LAKYDGDPIERIPKGVAREIDEIRITRGEDVHLEIIVE
jgi:hypothetical protein